MKINKILSSATLLYGMSMAMSVGSCATPVQTNLLVTPRVQISLVFHRPETKSISLVMLFIPR